MSVLIIDNYDSFTYNLVQYVAELGFKPVVARNDEITVNEIECMAPTHIIISPGPGHPKNKADFGVCEEVIRDLGSKFPILGVCLGHQGMALVYGGDVVRAPQIMHGKVSEMKCIDVEECVYPNIFKSFSKSFEAMRYHSLIADRDSLPDVLQVSVETAEDGLIMAFQHKEYPMYGVQFHPESIGTPVGLKILGEFLHVRASNEGSCSNNLINKLEEGMSLSLDESKMVMRHMMAGELSDDQMASLLVSLAEKGETIEEMSGMAEVMRSLTNGVDGHEDAVDTCGTGGSGLSRINTSTMVAFILSAGGVKVAKHGNRASGGRCGSFDVLEALGAEIELNSVQVKRSLDEMGLGFMYAPLFHPSMKAVGPVRRKLGRRTVFNVLGPLTNPAKVKRQILGVSSVDLGEKMVNVLKALGHERAMVVCGSDGLDEITLTGKTTVFELNKKSIQKYEILPSTYGIEEVSFDDISGGNVDENVRLFRGVLDGTIQGAHRDMVVLNAAAGFVVADKVEDFQAGVEKATWLLTEGLALKQLEKYIDLTKQL
jgi:anthranilate synthase/phosphoribosyltransferase